MKKKFISILLCFAMIMSMAALLTSCGGKEEADKTGAEDGKTGESEEVVTLKVGMIGKDIKTACIIIAEELGYFDEAGIDVQFEKINSLPDGLTAVSLDKLDILPFGSIPSCSFISQGTDVVIFGGTISEGSEGIVADGTRYTELSQFEGKKFGCFRMETGHMIMKGFLREAGIDAEFIYLDSFQSIVEAVNKGEVDIGMVNSGYGYIAEQTGASVGFQVGDFEKDFPCCRQTASRNTVENKRDALVRFEMAALRAYVTFMNDKKTSIDALVKYSGQDAEYVEAIMYGTEDYDNAMIVSLDPNKKKMEDFYEVMKGNGDIDKDTKYDIADYIDTSIYEDALKNLIEEGENAEIYEQLLEEFEVNNK